MTLVWDLERLLLLFLKMTHPGTSHTSLTQTQLKVTICQDQDIFLGTQPDFLCMILLTPVTNLKYYGWCEWET